MRRRRNADEVARLLREADRDLAKGLTVSDICRKQGIAETTYYRWRQATRSRPSRYRSPVPRAGARGRSPQEAGGRAAPGQNDAPGHRKKKVVSPDQQRAAADYLDEQYGVSQRRICRVMGRSRSSLRYRRKRRADEPALNREIKRLARRHPRYGYRFDPRLAGPAGLGGQPQTGAAALDQPGAEAAREAEKTQEIRPKAGDPVPIAAPSNRPGSRTMSGPATSSTIGRPSGRPLKWLTLGGRIYSGVLGAARGRVDIGGRCSADHGPGHWTSRSADSHQERQRIGVHLRGVGELAAGVWGRSRSRWPREAPGRMAISNRFTVGCVTSSWSGWNSRMWRMLERRRRGTGGNITRSGLTARWDTRRRKSSVRPVTRRTTKHMRSHH